MRKVVLLIIKIYQKIISPLFSPSCRFYPTCSEYSYGSIEKHGILKGGWYSILRILKCHPYHHGGFDPIK
jgi:putative membrane protein insertion efficiency factor